MIVKKPALILLVLAIAGGAAAYYFDWKRGNEPKTDTFKRAYALQAADVVSLVLSHPARPSDPAIHFAKHGDAWQVVDPIQTDADQSVVDGIVDQVAGAEVLGTEPGTPDRLKAYGLDPPQASLELQLANGSKHTLLVGANSFTGDSIYALVDGGQSVSLLPQLLATSTARTLDTLRDRSILRFDSGQIASFMLRSPSGELAAAKQSEQWKFTKPTNTLASQDAVDSLLQAVSGAKMASVVSEKPDDLARYGLANPPVSLAVTDAKGAQSTLQLGRKDGDAYFARDVSRPTVFRVGADLYAKLTQKFSDLRDKKIVHVDSADVQQIEVRNAGGSISLSKKKDGSEEWVFDAPADQKGKPATSWKVLDPLTGASADEVIDKPAANQLALVANPAVTAILTDKGGKTLTIRVSKPAGDFIYAQASDGVAVFKLKKEVLDSLNVKAADLAP